MARAFPLLLVLAILAGLVALGVLLPPPEPPLRPVEKPLEPPEPPQPPEPVSEVPEGPILRPVSFAALEGWARDHHSQALDTFLVSCTRLLPQPADRPTEGIKQDGVPFAGTLGDWHQECRAARQVPDGDDAAARAFFEARFTPVLIRPADREDGLFTGYYVPVIEGRRVPDERFDVPLRGRPDSLVSVNLGAFEPALKGQHIYGRVQTDGIVTRLQPYFTREDIAGGVLDAQNLELVWLEDPVDAFFMHIQGSGLIRLGDGSVIRLGFAGKNGLPYTSIGRVLVDRGEMTLDQASMQSIRAWVAANPDQADDVLNQNKSYVFFAEQAETGAVGAQGVVLTAGRSLAIDRRYLPLGVPLWVEIEGAGGDRETAIHRLMVAQDTGGAIKGVIRGDFFWGEGDEAGAVAGRMKNRGIYYVLLPKAVAGRLAP